MAMRTLTPEQKQALAALRPFEKYLRWLPMGGQYFVCASNPKPEQTRAA